MKLRDITVENFKDFSFLDLSKTIRPLYTVEVPSTAVDKEPDIASYEKYMDFFCNIYAYIAELWSAAASHVRELKRSGADKDTVDESVDKRDYLDKVLSATKLKYYDCRLKFKYHGERLK